MTLLSLCCLFADSLLRLNQPTSLLRYPASSALPLSIRSIEMLNWGVFNSLKTELRFETPKSYIAITGETGSGKSLFIEAISYLCGYKRSSKFCDHGYIHLSLINQTSEITIHRSYNHTTKKSTYEYNGKRITAKEIQWYLRNIIRFWTSEDIQKLDDLMKYVDYNLGDEHLQRLDALEVTHDNWKQVYEKLLKLREIESKGVLDSKADSETKRLIDEANRLSLDVQNLLREIEAVLRNADSNLRSRGSQTAEALSLIGRIDDNRKRGTGTTFSDSWEALIAAEVLIKKLTQAVETIRVTTKPSSSAAVEVPGAISRAELKSIESKLYSFSTGMIDVEAQFRSLGWLPMFGSGDFDKIHVAAEDALRQIKSVQSQLNQIAKNLPDLADLLARIHGVKGRWESLAKKLSAAPIGLDTALSQLESTLNDIENLSEMLPLVSAHEDKLRKQYLSGALEISKYRYNSALDLTRKVNELLPSLEVKKMIRIRHQTLNDFFGDGSEGDKVALLSPLHPQITAHGWDSMTMVCEAQEPTDGSWEFVDLDVDTIQEKEEAPDEELASESMSRALSSGEQARLALAFEALTSGLESESSESLLILDEIDAHVGGDAAVAVAKLMKQLGSRRQVIAVTHNPLLAAAADEHLLVQRLDSTQTSSKQASRKKFKESSVIVRLSDQANKESELSRMATGNLGIGASLELARALLKVDFGSP